MYLRNDLNAIKSTKMKAIGQPLLAWRDLCVAQSFWRTDYLSLMTPFHNRVSGISGVLVNIVRTYGALSEFLQQTRMKQSASKVTRLVRI